IFCSADLSNEAIQGWMSQLGPKLNYRILPEASSSIIGSHRSDQRGTLYTIDVNLRIDEAANRRAKWLFDKGMCLLLLLFTPLLIWWIERKEGFLGNLLRVGFGGKHWVGYAPNGPGKLPRLRPGVLHPGIGRDTSDEATVGHLNFLYARDFTVTDDWRILWNNLRFLGNKPVLAPAAAPE
ncbi:MAG: glycosyl transferase family 2, partial [Bacteroidota bacterium]